MRERRTYFRWLLPAMMCVIYNSIYSAPQQPADSVRSTHHYFSTLPESDKHYFHVQDSAHIVSAVRYPGTFQLKKGIRVFGWYLPGIHSRYENYNYSLLTHIAYFNCDIDSATGKLANRSGWDTSSIVSYAKAKNASCKVLLTVTCFGKSKLHSFLNNAGAQTSLINELFTAITQKNGDGVCIDFEGVTADEKDALSKFMTQLRQKFNTKKLVVSFTLPSVDTSPSAYNFSVLEKQVDLFVLMGYDYFGSFSHNAGPIAPLETKAGWIPESIEKSVTYYLQSVQDSVLILAVPYYGAIWETTTGTVPSGPGYFLRYRSYSYAWSLSLSDSFPSVINNPDLKASYYVYANTDKLRPAYTMRQFWIDNEYSLGLKYDYILNKKLGGVGIWALGFDEGTTDLWRLLQNKFTVDTLNPVAVSPAGSSSINVQEILSLVESKPVISGISLFLVLTTLLVVLIKVISDAANREKLKQSGLVYLIYISIVALFCAMVYGLCLFCFNLSVMISSIVIGILLMAIAVLRVVKINRDRQMP